MIKLTTKIENIDQLRAERARLKVLADAKEQEITNQFKQLNERLKPIHKALGFFMKGGGGDNIMSSAFVSGLKSVFPYLLGSVLTGRKKGFFGAATAVGGDLLLKNLKNIDVDRILSSIGGLFKWGKKKEQREDEFIDWEREIYS
ncbi:hypothetical protein NF867_09040 [Solitalea sp. MAHUQ-68]|uniref:Uncharacterized protein n=1 Tax=Solitalea agri TaxID=2953739 RepID=A0A9X2JF37_9SPHI|nr:hypothetical protein [Solitalea agri]MCO4293006.1 hypothetical protein [Solitalea agri]